MNVAHMRPNICRLVASCAMALAATLPSAALLNLASAQTRVLSKPPIPIHPGVPIGEPLFPPGDTPTGGQGQHVNGIQADIGALIRVHFHIHLSLFHDGRQVSLPADIGILHLRVAVSPTQNVRVTAYYWLHTHDASGIVHIESPYANPPFRWTLGDFFAIWGRPLTAMNIAGWHGPTRIFVNGRRFDGNPRNIVLKPHEQLTLESGPPFVAPPVYSFPAGY